MRKILALMVCLVMFAVPVMANEPVMATLETLPSELTVYVRIESSAPGEEGTVLPRTPVTFGDNETHTALEAVTLAVEGALTVETSEYGSYITSLCGLGDESGQLSWMYAVNNELPWVGVDAYELNYGDELVFYYVDWQLTTTYAYFTVPSLTAMSGEPFELTLQGVDFSEGPFAVEEAQLIITTDDLVPMTRMLYYTQEDGTVSLSLIGPATYQVSARKSEPDGTSVISRPYCEVTVLAPEDPTVTIETPTNPDVVLVSPPTLVPVAPIYVLLPVVYNNETNEVWLYGIPYDLNAYPDKAFYDKADGTLMLPYRAVAEALGAEVSWQADTATVITKRSDLDFSFTIGDVYEGKAITIINDRTYVPANFIVEQFSLAS